MDDGKNLIREVRSEQERNKLTVDKDLLLLGQDADQVGAMEPTLPLSSVPGPTVCEVLVAVRLKLAPARSTHLCVCTDRKQRGEGEWKTDIDTEFFNKLQIAFYVWFRIYLKMRRTKHPLPD